MTNYNSDFYGWTQEQAALLKAGRLSEIDIENLIEEVETMGRSEKRELNSRLTVLLLHLLKWQFQPIRRGNSWRITIEQQRLEFKDVLDDNPSLKPLLDAILLQAYTKAKVAASKETAIDKSVFPELCPWSFSQLLDEGYYPD